MEENNKDNEFEVNQSKRDSHVMVIGVEVFLLIMIVSVAAYTFSNTNKVENDKLSASPTALIQPTLVATATTQTVLSGSYKNGEYSVTGDYISPGGQQQIGVTLTLFDGAIKDISITPKPSDDDSERYQTIFEKNYKAMVVGKKIDEVKLTKVSGSSLTSRGFQDALEKIKQEAKS